MLSKLLSRAALALCGPRLASARRNGGARFSRLEALERRDLLSVVPGIAHEVADGAPLVSLASPQMIRFLGETYFVGETAAHGQELWATNGTAAGTRLVRDIDTGASGSNIGNFTLFNGGLFFTASGRNPGNNLPIGFELWRTNGTLDGTVPLDINKQNNQSGSSNPSQLTVLNNFLYFAASDGIGGDGIELFRTDGNVVTNLDIDGDKNSGSSVANLTLFNGELYFTAAGPTGGVELWKTDGINQPTTPFADINPGSGSSNPHSLTVFNGELYFVANNGSSGFELWKTNGVTPPASPFADIDPRAENGSSVANLTVFNGNLYFTANNGSSGIELWRTNGTTVPPAPFADINLGAGPSSPSQLTVFNDRLFFVANNGALGFELWSTDGTAPPTSPVVDIDPRAENGGGIGNLLVSNGTLYFSANDGGLLLIF